MALGTFTQPEGNLSQRIAALLMGGGDKATRNTTNGSWPLSFYRHAYLVITDAQPAAMRAPDTESAYQPVVAHSAPGTEPAGAAVRPSYQPTAATNTTRTTTAQALLEAAAQAGDVAAFLDGYYATRWHDQPAEVLVRVIRLALQAGAHVAARELSKLGLQSYPMNPDVQRLASIFYSNKPGRRSPPDPSTAANLNWIRTHASEYRGKWVALRGEALLASADSLDNLLKITGDVRGTDIFVGPVF
jgi:hypothetical protein